MPSTAIVMPTPSRTEAMAKVPTPTAMVIAQATDAGPKNEISRREGLPSG